MKYKLSEQRKRLIAEYERKISHEKCDSQIRKLSEEIEILHKEHVKDVQNNINVFMLSLLGYVRNGGFEALQNQCRS